ncbi:hypothetical protein [Lysinibacillus sphaericus]|uniref:hypothetical protein n=1 Tax=Lysinibacillus sphaericus TaxID=1421 RepID=UPI003D7523F8
MDNKYNSVNLENYITKLRSNIFEEIINNPLLLNYDNTDLSETIKAKDYEIIYIENFILKEYDEDIETIYKILYKNNIHYYLDFDEGYVRVLFNTIKNYNSQSKEIINIIFEVFFEGKNINIKHDLIYYIKEFQSIRKYYRNFIKKTKSWTLKQFINKELYRYSLLNFKLIFIGKSFGEVNNQGIESDYYEDNKWVKLDGKTDAEIINYILIKYKIDSDFINYDLNNFVNALFEFEILSENDVNIFNYGTEDINIISLQRLGFSRNLINKITNDSKLDLFIFDENNNLKNTEELQAYLKVLNGIEKFEVEKYL